MYKTALLGNGIEYTESPKIHAAIADVIDIGIKFDVFDTPYDKLSETVKTLISEYDGFFITKPYKKDILHYVQGDINAANVVRCRDKSAQNTDGVGFVRALDRNFDGWRNRVHGALVLGAGGSAHAVAQALLNIGKKVYVLNRTVMNAARLCAALGAELYSNQPAELIINCTTVGQSGEDVLRSLCLLPEFAYAFDLIYNCGKTPFLRRCEGAGASVQNGADMLIYQAIEGDKIIFDANIDVETVFERVKQNLRHGDQRRT